MPKIIRGIFIAVFFTLIGASTGYCLTDSDVAQAIGTHRILARCTGSDVNLRSEAKTDSEVIGSLEQGEVVYGIDRLNGENWPWLQVITQNGKTGWVYGKYFRADDAALSETNLWKANFASRTFFTLEALENITGVVGEHQPLTTEDKKNVTSYCNGKRICGPITVYVYNNRDEIFTSALVTEVGYDAGGVRIGDSISNPEAQSFGKMLKQVEGWEEGPDAMQNGANWWYYKGMVDRHKRPLRGICITCDKDKVVSIWWGIYLVD